MNQKKPKTHGAFALKREGRTRFRPIEIGDARVEGPDAIVKQVHHVYLDRLPIGGFSGHVILIPKGMQPEGVAINPLDPSTDEADP